MNLMLIEIMGGPHDGVEIEIDNPMREQTIGWPGYPLNPYDAAMRFAGVPVYKDEEHGGKLYIRWVDLEARADALRYIGPAIDRVLLLMHEREFTDDP